MNAANAALQKAGVLGNTFDDLDALLDKWSDIVQPVEEKFDTELTSKVFYVNNGFQVGTTWSDGQPCAGYVICGVSPEGGTVRGGWEWGYIHTHPSNYCPSSCFSDGDLYSAHMVEVRGGAGIAYVSLPNHQVWAGTWEGQGWQVR